MKWVIDRTFLPIYLGVAIEGKPTAEEYRTLSNEILSDQSWQPGTAILSDITNRDPLGPDATDITESLADYFIARREAIGPMVIAIVSHDPQTYQYNHMFEYSIRMRRSQVAVRTFSTEEEAAEWLTEVYHLNNSVFAETSTN